jgi:hypothetical protein
MNKAPFLLLLPLLFGGCDKPQPAETTAYRPERIVIDDAVIDSGDYYKVIDPVWWSADIYDSHQRYLESLKDFSLPQRYFFAVAWYEAEVNNGGHAQFYGNSTGIVGRDALEGLNLVGASERAAILEESAKRLGGTPHFDRNRRAAQLQANALGFDDLDTTFHGLQDDLHGNLNAYIREHREEFYFRGVVAKPVLSPGQ